MDIAQPRRKKNLISLTSLIDVVFILLVFFMLASSFTRWNTIELGVSAADTVTLENTEQSLINIQHNQQYLLNGKVQTLDSIVKQVNKQLQHQPSHTILVKPEKHLPLQQLIVVLEALGSTASKNISLVKDEA